ncbi:MAG: hypothetical protein Q9227_000913 [Pyrenula ochraceoflavens]
MQCTGQQIVELTCKYCGITKPLDGFAKQQRHNPDDAGHLDELENLDALSVENYYDAGVDSELASTYHRSTTSNNLTSTGSVGSSADFMEESEDGVYDPEEDSVPPHSVASMSGFDMMSNAPDGVDNGPRNFPRVRPEPKTAKELVQARKEREHKHAKELREVERFADSDDDSEGLPY